MDRVLVIHRDTENIEERATQLRAAGYEADSFRPGTVAELKQILAKSPVAAVLDLTRAPSCGRELAVWLRINGSTRNLPLIFAGGQLDKVEVIKKILPDAAYTSWERVADSVKKAVRNPPESPVVPKSIMDSYAGRPLVKKLGIKPGSTVALVDAPAGFEKNLGELPKRTVLHRGADKPADLTLWFNRSQAGLEEGLKRMADFAGDRPIWIIWPKKGSSLQSDLSQTSVRKTGLDNGLVDYKVCAVDQTWSGLLFTKRKEG
jgi:hypothetical protein